MSRLGAGKFFDCPQCGVRFLLREPIHDVIVMLDGEVSTREEDLLDPFCGATCAETYREEQSRKSSERYSFIYSSYYLPG